MRERMPVRRWITRAIAGTAVASLAATAGCSVLAPDGAAASRVLQSVDVTMDGDAAITAVTSTAISLDDSNSTSTSETTDYATKDVVSDLPLRVTTAYRSDAGAGTNLDDLAGYSGRVEITIGLENVTVTPVRLSYDAAGQSRSSPALVGVPLSIAASARLDGVSPEKIVFGEDSSATSGVVSQTPQGEALVQWATLLAPPQTEATARFSVVADVVDFQVPGFDIAVQTGLHTDPSFEGVVTSAFDGTSSSELGVQQRAITLVTEVNGVLNRAGATISEVRANLGDTSKTLGVRAAQRLGDSSASLSAEMRTLSQQLASLQTALNGTATGTQSAMNSQLSQIVASMSGVLGETSGKPPRVVDGDGCAAKVEGDRDSGSLYGMFLLLAGQLTGYAEVNDSCKDEVLAELDTTLGPTDPDEASCTSASLTCALYGAKKHVLSSLTELVDEGERIVAEFDTDTIAAAIAEHGVLDGTIDSVTEVLATLDTSPGNGTVLDQLRGLQQLILRARGSLTKINDIHATAGEALDSLSDAERSTRDLRDEICELLDDGVDAKRVERLRARVHAESCDPELPSAERPDSMQQRFIEQADLWTAVRSASDTKNPESASGQLSAVLDSFLEALKPILSGTGDLNATIDQLKQLDAQAQEQSETLGSSLGEISQQQDTMLTGITSAFENAAAKTSAAVDADVIRQIRVVESRVAVGRDRIAESYDRTVRGLRSTSASMLDDAKTQIDGQKGALAERYAEATATLNEQTASSLERINASTSASSRDVDAASRLLADSLNRVILDLGNPRLEGSGILGAMSASAARAGTADYQLTLASQQAAGFANIRVEDIDGIMLRQAQFEAAIEAAAAVPSFHLDVPAGAVSHTIYSFRLGGGGQ